MRDQLIESAGEGGRRKKSNGASTEALPDDVRLLPEKALVGVFIRIKPTREPEKGGIGFRAIHYGGTEWVSNKSAGILVVIIAPHEGVSA